MFIEDLMPGEQFELAGVPGRTGRLVYLSDGAALIRYDGSKHVELRDARTDTVVAFESSNRPLTISRRTEVVRR